MDILSDRERYLARSALGLGHDDRQQSYRNRYVLFDQSDDHDTWVSMAERGLAEMDREFWPKPSTFRLTRMGAEAALKPGESLDREDFPASPQSPTDPAQGEP